MFDWFGFDQLVAKHYYKAIKPATSRRAHCSGLWCYTCDTLHRNVQLRHESSWWSTAQDTQIVCFLLRKYAPKQERRGPRLKLVGKGKKMAAIDYFLIGRWILLVTLRATWLGLSNLISYKLFHFLSPQSDDLGCVTREKCSDTAPNHLGGHEWIVSCSYWSEYAWTVCVIHRYIKGIQFGYSDRLRALFLTTAAGECQGRVKSRAK